MDTEQVRECERNGYRTDTKRISNGYGTVTEHKNYKSVLQENVFFRTHATLQYKSRYQSSMIIRVLTRDLKTIQF